MFGAYDRVRGFPVVQEVETTCQGRRRKGHKVGPYDGKVPWRRKWQPTPGFSPGNFQGQRSLVVYSSWGHKELDTTQCTHARAHAHTHTHGRVKGSSLGNSRKTPAAFLTLLVLFFSP